MIVFSRRMAFAVNFSDGLAIISSMWFVGEEEEECFWPPGSLAAVARMAQQHQLPNKRDWQQYKVRVLGKAGNVSQFTPHSIW